MHPKVWDEISPYSLPRPAEREFDRPTRPPDPSAVFLILLKCKFSLDGHKRSCINRRVSAGFFMESKNSPFLLRLPCGHSAPLRSFGSPAVIRLPCGHSTPLRSFDSPAVIRLAGFSGAPAPPKAAAELSCFHPIPVVVSTGADAYRFANASFPAGCTISPIFPDPNS